MNTQTWMSKLFTAIDAKDSEAFSACVTEDCQFTFGNMPPVAGRAAIETFVGQFFQSIAALQHSITDTWTIPGGVVCRGRVCYTRLDGSELDVPFCNVFILREGLASEYQIYADTSLLYSS